MREIDRPAFAAAHADGALVIDVREPMEYLAGHVPGARLIPRGQLASRTSELPKDQRIFVICASGNRSLAMTDLLQRLGFDAVSVAGGTSGWAADGRPIATGSTG